MFCSDSRCKRSVSSVAYLDSLMQISFVFWPRKTQRTPVSCWLNPDCYKTHVGYGSEILPWTHIKAETVTQRKRWNRSTEFVSAKSCSFYFYFNLVRTSRVSTLVISRHEHRASSRVLILTNFVQKPMLRPGASVTLLSFGHNFTRLSFCDFIEVGINKTLRWHICFLSPPRRYHPTNSGSSCWAGRAKTEIMFFYVFHSISVIIKAFSQASILKLSCFDVFFISIKLSYILSVNLPL